MQSQSFFPPHQSQLPVLTVFCGMKRAAAGWKTACCRKREQENKEHQSKKMGPKRSWQCCKEPPSHLCNLCSRELGTPGMPFLGPLPSSQLAAVLQLGVNERNSGFNCAILPLSKTQQSGRKGGALARGTQIYSVQSNLLRRTGLVEQVATLQC